MLDFSKELTAIAEAKNRPFEMALSDWMDFMIEFHDVKFFNENNWVQHVVDFAKKEEGYFSLMMAWMDEVANCMEKGHWWDCFGELYESKFLLRAKSANTGQFFTPPSLCDLMAKMQTNNGEKKIGKISDCACGSGRLLLAHYMDVANESRSDARKCTYHLVDSDMTACKMAALNVMIHGMSAKVICQDTLAQDKPKVIYYINEAKYPINTPYYSIRVEYPE